MTTALILRVLIISMLALGALTTTASAQRERGRGKEARKARAELRNELRTWFTKSVYPTMKQWHDAYDAQLSASDRATLLQLRTESRQARERLEDGLTKLLTAPRGERRDIAEDIRDDYRSTMKSIIDRVTPIAKSSRTFLRDLFDKNETQLEAWRTDSRKIVEAWHARHDNEGDRPRKKIGGLPLLGGDGRKAALRFILWDGTLEQAVNDDDGDRPDRR